MARVDPSDDSITRWIVYHHRFDPSRNEVRRVVLAVFSVEKEFDKFVVEENAKLEVMKSIGEAKNYEWIAGNIKYPYQDLQAKEHRANLKRIRSLAKRNSQLGRS